MPGSPHEESEFPLLTVQMSNWLLLLVLVAGSWIFTTPFVAKGVLAGGLIANVSFIILKRDLSKIMAGPIHIAKVRFFLRYYVRLAVLAVILFLLVKYRAVHVVGLVTGLSTVVLSIGFTTAGLVKKYFFVAKEAS
jgi:hypothetical protein